MVSVENNEINRLNILVTQLTNQMNNLHVNIANQVVNQMQDMGNY